MCIQSVHTFVPLAATRSIAPPIPFTIFPGIIQLARSPFLDTYSNTRSIIQLERSPSHPPSLQGSSHWPGLHSWTPTPTQGQSFSEKGLHPLHHLPRDHPVGQVSILGHLHQHKVKHSVRKVSIPFTIFPGIIQLARSPFLDTYINTSRVSDPDPDPYPDPYWIRIQSEHWIRIRNLNTDPDPDPGGQK